MRNSSCQVSSLIGLIVTYCAGDIFTDARVLGGRAWMSKTASGQSGKVKGPPVFMLNNKRQATYPQTELAVVGEPAAFVLVRNKLWRGGALPGCEGVWENCPSG